MRLAHVPRDVLRANDVATQPESRTIALLLHDTRQEHAVAVTRRITSRWSSLTDAQARPSNGLAFSLIEASAQDNLADVWSRLKGALDEARRPGRAQVVAAWRDQGTVSYRRFFLGNGRRAA